MTKPLYLILDASPDTWTAVQNARATYYFECWVPHYLEHGKDGRIFYDHITHVPDWMIAYAQDYGVRTEAPMHPSHLSNQEGLRNLYIGEAYLQAREIIGRKGEGAELRAEAIMALLEPLLEHRFYGKEAYPPDLILATLEEGGMTTEKPLKI